MGLLTPYGAQGFGGVEVFNESLRQALGNVETFANDGPTARGRWGDLNRAGLEQPMRAIHAARALLHRHREEPFDLILSNGLYGWPLTLARPGVPLVQVYHNTIAGFADRALTMRGDRFTTKHVMAFFDRLAGIGKEVVVVSRPLQREVESLYGFKTRLIPNAIDTNAFRPQDPVSARAALGIPEDAVVGVFVGRPDHTKGYDTVLRVAGRLPEVLFLVAGGTPGVSGNIRAVGRVAHEDMPQLYAASDFFFLPSRYEGLSLALLEALACNLPVVVSEAGWPFPDESASCGVVVQGDEENGFLDAIRYVLSGRTFSSRAFVSARHGFKVFRDRWRNLVTGLVGQGG